jgi:GMP synthase-like glutamine amidotransferase
VLLISHEPEAAPAIIGQMLRARGVRTDQHVVLVAGHEPDVDFPDPAGYDLVISFGSFANAYDPQAQGWVQAEVGLIRQLLDHETPFLGVCFGGQLLGMALGGQVERAPDGEEEVGVVEMVPERDVELPIPAGPWFAWHEDRIVLPDGVEVLARTDRAVQMFRAGRAVGLQFHPEVDLALVADWLRIGEHHLPDGWTSGQLLTTWARVEPEAHRNCEQLVDWLLDHVVRGEVA